MIDVEKVPILSSLKLITYSELNEMTRDVDIYLGDVIAGGRKVHEGLELVHQ